MYGCPACGTFFDGLDKRSGYRNINPDEPGDAELKCAGCQRWMAQDLFVPVTNRSTDNESKCSIQE